MKKVKRKNRLAQSERLLLKTQNQLSGVHAELAAKDANLTQANRLLELEKSSRKYDNENLQRQLMEQRKAAEEYEKQQVLAGLRAQVNEKDVQMRNAMNERDRILDVVKWFTSISINGLEAQVIQRPYSDSMPSMLRQM